LRASLFRSYTPDAFRARYVDLFTNVNDLTADPESHPRAAEAAVIGGGPSARGVVLIHYYAWPLIAPQLCIRPIPERGRVQAIALAPFHQLVATPQTPRIVAEIAGLWVKPAYRRQGLGRQLYTYALGRIKAVLGARDFLFVAVRGRYTRARSTMISECLFAAEQAAHGLDPESGKPWVSGLPLSAASLRLRLTIAPDQLPVHPTAVGSLSLVRNDGYSFLGFSRSLNPMLGRLMG
jgi:GNAT superfamily N-acetyltransferase